MNTAEHLAPTHRWDDLTAWAFPRPRVESSHDLEIMAGRAKVRALAHEPRRSLSATIRRIDRIFAEAEMANARVK